MNVCEGYVSWLRELPQQCCDEDDFVFLLLPLSRFPFRLSLFLSRRTALRRMSIQGTTPWSVTELPSPHASPPQETVGELVVDQCTFHRVTMSNAETVEIQSFVNCTPEQVFAIRDPKRTLEEDRQLRPPSTLYFGLTLKCSWSGGQPELRCQRLMVVPFVQAVVDGILRDLAVSTVAGAAFSGSVAQTAPLRLVQREKSKPSSFLRPCRNAHDVASQGASSIDQRDPIGNDLVDTFLKDRLASEPPLVFIARQHTSPSGAAFFKVNVARLDMLQQEEDDIDDDEEDVRSGVRAPATFDGFFAVQCSSLLPSSVLHIGVHVVPVAPETLPPAAPRQPRSSENETERMLKWMSPWYDDRGHDGDLLMSEPKAESPAAATSTTSEVACPVERSTGRFFVCGGPQYVVQSGGLLVHS